jgi:hypothetical protein
MIRTILIWALGAALLANASAQEDSLRPTLEATYRVWRDAMVRKDVSAWQQITAAHRQVEVKNRLVSEKRAFPASLFDIPAQPPSLDGLKALQVTRNGPTAIAVYFGKIDFNVGGDPTENLLVISFDQEARGWRYDKADFVNLTGLADVRAELKKGDLQYLKQNPDFRPSGVIPPVPMEVQPAKTIAKVYVFAPGREVQVQINKVSRHRIANTREAEIILGGARDGSNEVQYAVRKLEGATGKEAMTIRVYLFSEVEGIKPVKVFEYQVAEGGAVKPSGTENFTVDAAVLAKLQGK